MAKRSATGTMAILSDRQHPKYGRKVFTGRRTCRRRASSAGWSM
jgi:hypothetical protein